jgi:Zn-dependent alcohol dehydrogenase
MKCRGAVMRGVGRDWEIEEITLDPPREGEVLVKMTVAGVCHSDDHFSTGDMVPTPDLAAIMESTGAPPVEYFPLLGGHEGPASSQRLVPACGPCSPVITSRCRSLRRVDAVAGACRA